MLCPNIAGLYEELPKEGEFGYISAWKSDFFNFKCATKHVLDLNHSLEDLIVFILTTSFSQIVFQAQCMGQDLQYLRVSKASSGVSKNLTRQYQL